MKIANVILVHKNPGQILRLLNRLTCDGLDNWVHIDAKCNTIDPAIFANLKNVHLINPRIGVSWGCFNTVEAMIHCMQVVSGSGKGYDYLNFLSGQDYPLRPPTAFCDYICENDGYEFIGNRPYEETLQNIKRIREYHLNRFCPPSENPGNGSIEKVINLLLPKRKFPYPYQIRKGPQWMALSSPAISYILNFVSYHPVYVNYFKWVHIPDEFFFQTILYNSSFRQRMRNEIFHYIDWTENKKNPKVFTIADESKLRTTNLYFARKFDMAVDTAILDMLDLKIQASGNIN